MNESAHQFRRYIRRMIGRKIRYEALCECGWRSPSSDVESVAWGYYCLHSEQAAWPESGFEHATWSRKAEQLLTGQEP